MDVALVRYSTDRGGGGGGSQQVKVYCKSGITEADRVFKSGTADGMSSTAQTG